MPCTPCHGVVPGFEKQMDDAALVLEQNRVPVGLCIDLGLYDRLGPCFTTIRRRTDIDGGIGMFFFGACKESDVKVALWVFGHRCGVALRTNKVFEKEGLQNYLKQASQRPISAILASGDKKTVLSV